MVKIISVSQSHSLTSRPTIPLAPIFSANSWLFLTHDFLKRNSKVVKDSREVTADNFLQTFTNNQGKASPSDRDSTSKYLTVSEKMRRRP